MIVENSVRGAQYSLAVAFGIPCDAHSWLKVAGICLDAFLQSEEVVSRKRQRIRLGKFGSKLHVVPQAIIQSQIRTRAPRVLPKYPERFVGKRIVRVPNALNEVARKSGSVGLHG